MYSTFWYVSAVEHRDAIDMLADRQAETTVEEATGQCHRYASKRIER